MPRKFNPDVVTTNVRLPKKLHRDLEREAKRLNVSLNAEVVYRLEKSFKQASAEQLTELIRRMIRRYPIVLEDEKVTAFIEELEELASQLDVTEDLERR
jgi:hypothetical protein